MQRHDALARAHRQRRPRREPEVRVHDVEVLAGESLAERPRGAGVGARAAGSERVDLHVEAGVALQGLHLVAHEAAERGPAGGRIHVRDDERAHLVLRSVSPFALGRLLAPPGKDAGSKVWLCHIEIRGRRQAVISDRSKGEGTWGTEHQVAHLHRVGTPSRPDRCICA